MRVQTNLTDEDREKVAEYAERNGYRMSLAYTKLVREGLKNVEEAADE